MRDEAKAKYEDTKKKLAEAFLVTYPDVRFENLYALLDLVEHNVLEFVFTKPEATC